MQPRTPRHVAAMCHVVCVHHGTRVLVDCPRQFVAATSNERTVRLDNCCGSHTIRAWHVQDAPTAIGATLCGLPRGACRVPDSPSSALTFDAIKARPDSKQDWVGSLTRGDNKLHFLNHQRDRQTDYGPFISEQFSMSKKQVPAAARPVPQFMDHRVFAAFLQQSTTHNGDCKSHVPRCHKRTPMERNTNKSARHKCQCQS